MCNILIKIKIKHLRLLRATVYTGLVDKKSKSVDQLNVKFVIEFIDYVFIISL